MENVRIQWHPAFCAAIKMELEDYQDVLQFLEEYPLTRKPLQIDVLIIRRVKSKKILAPVGRFFKEHNIIEYKGPGDFFSVADFHKVVGYACIYQSNTNKNNRIRPEEITITIVVNHYPCSLIKYLRRRYQVREEKDGEGIYYLSNLMFPVRILVTKQLSGEDFVWVSRLRENLDYEKDIRLLVQKYGGKKGELLYDTVMDCLICANREKFEEGKRMLGNAFRQLFADEIEEFEQKRKEEEQRRKEEEQKRKAAEQKIEEMMRSANQKEQETSWRVKQQTILELLTDLGEVPVSLKQRIGEQTDSSILLLWNKLAVTSPSVPAFAEAISKTV